MKHTLLLALVAVTAASYGQSLSTAAPNNGSGGVFMELTSAWDMNVTQFDVPLGAAAGTSASIEVWTRPGNYSGFTASNVGWTLHDTISAVAGGTTTWVPGVLNNQLTLLTGQTMSVYLHSVTLGNGIRYTGTGTGGHPTTFNNGDLTLFSDITRTGNVAFGGTQFSPRTFSGTVHYEAVPEPATMAILGVAGLAALRRRKK